MSPSEEYGGGTYREKYYEIHAEHDGHVSGDNDRERAEKRAKELTEEFGQEHTVKEVWQ